MGSEFTFYDYVNGSGENEIRGWLESIPPKPRRKFRKWLLHLEGTKKGSWTRPMADTLRGYCQNLFEVRVSLDRQYRILGAHPKGMDKTPTLLHCFIKSDDEVPPEDCDRAFVKVAEVEGNAAKYRVEHKYDQ